jgi:hypothetical protein
MKYDVHLFTIVRVKIPNVEADSHSEAAKKAAEQTDMDALFNDTDSCGIVTEWAEEHSHALVDVVGDKEYTKSKWLCKDLTRPMNFSRPRPAKKG